MSMVLVIFKKIFSSDLDYRIECFFLLYLKIIENINRDVDYVKVY